MGNYYDSFKFIIMEKNLSIIQGLTSTDQANPIRITDAGEVKTVVDNAVLVYGTVTASVNPITPGDQADQNTGVNAPMGITEANTFERLELIDNNTYLSGVTNHVQKLLVDQAKSFTTVESYLYDASGTPAVDIPDSIITAISQWTSTHGTRYDDIIITPYTANNGIGAIKYLVGITIIRYY